MVSRNKNAPAVTASAQELLTMANLPAPPTDVKPPGWFRAMRTNEPIELIEANPYAFILAYLIAYRAQFSDKFNRHNLALGESFLGDFKKCGMSQQNYRTAKAQLEKWGFATFRVTNKGTIGKLADTRLFAVFRLEGNEQNNTPLTNSQRTANEQLTSTENEEIEENEKDRKDDRIDPRIVLNVESFRAGAAAHEPDWHGLSLEQKAYRVLGSEEWLRNERLWKKRAATQYNRLEEVIDVMHAVCVSN